MIDQEAAEYALDKAENLTKRAAKETDPAKRERLLKLAANYRRDAQKLMEV